MTEIQRTDRKSRSQVLVVTLVGALIGAVLIMVFTRYREELGAWLGDTPSESRTRFGVVLAVMAALCCSDWLSIFGFSAGALFVPKDSH